MYPSKLVVLLSIMHIASENYHNVINFEDELLLVSTFIVYINVN